MEKQHLRSIKIWKCSMVGYISIDYSRIKRMICNHIL